MKTRQFVHFVFFAAAMLSMCGCPNLVNPPSKYNQGLNAGISGSQDDINGAIDTQSDLSQNVTGAQSDVKSADGRLATAPQQTPIPQARGDLSHAGDKLTRAQADNVKLQQQLADAKSQLATVQATASQQQTAIGTLESTCKTLQAFYDEWCHSWTGPRLWGWMRGILITCIVIGLIWAAMQFFPMFAPVLAMITNAFGVAFKFVITVGIPHLTAIGKYLITRGVTLLKTFVAWVEAKHAAMKAPVAAK